MKKLLMITAATAMMSVSGLAFADDSYSEDAAVLSNTTPAATEQLMEKEGTLEGNIEVLEEQAATDAESIPTSVSETVTETGDVLEIDPSAADEEIDQDLSVEEGLTTDESAE